MKKRFYATVVLCFFMAGILSAQVQNEDARRLEVVRQYVDAAKFVCDKTGNESAKWLYASMVTMFHPLRITPHFAEKIPKPSGKLNNFPLAILALLQSDYQKKDLAPAFKQHLDPKTAIGGSYSLVMGAVIVVENNDSPLVKGMVMLHEAGHAASFLEKKIPFPKEETPDVIEETQIHIFEEKLWRLIGGQTYESLIIREVARLRANFKKEGFKGFKEILKNAHTPGFSLKSFTYPELKNLVVPSTGEREMAKRQGALTQSALFRMVDQDVPEADHQADRVKASVVHYLHKIYGVYK